MSSTDKTIAFVTGANQGIGLSAATRLAKEHNYLVIIGSRNLENGQKVADTLKKEGFEADAVQLDLQSDESINAAVAYIKEKYGRLDVLVNNAGVLLDMNKDLSTRQLFDTTFSTNVTGTAVLTEALLPLIRASTQRPRVIFVSSTMGSVSISLDATKPWYAGDYKAYDASKAALNILTANYSRILADKKARVNSVCPGLVSTNLTGYVEYGTTTELGSQRIIELATVTGEGTDVTGTFTNRDNETIPW